MMNYRILLFLLLGIMAACKGKPEEAPEVNSEVAQKVYATVETEAVQQSSETDAADDPALWYNKVTPSASLVLGSNKRMGLEVYNLAGKRLASYNSGRLNNIDVRYGFLLNGQSIDLVAGSNRSHNRIDIWSIDPSGQAFQLVSDSSHRSGLAEVYGFCLYKSPADSMYYAFVNDKTGAIEQWRLADTGNGFITLSLVRSLKARRQVEGMVADDEKGLLYVGEEEGGILVFSAEPADSVGFRQIARSGSDNSDLKYDIEGLALYYSPEGKGYLLASSQGNNRIAVFERQSPNQYLGYFSVQDSLVDGAQETDGIEVVNLNLGEGFSSGVFICQDGENRDNGVSHPQNFKLVPWQFVARSTAGGLAINPSYRGIK